MRAPLVPRTRPPVPRTRPQVPRARLKASRYPLPPSPPSTGLPSTAASSTDLSSTGMVAASSAPAFWQGGRRPDWLVGQLPIGMLDDDFFYRFVSIFQDEAVTYLDDIDNLANIIDPAVAPPSMVRFMGAWLALPAINPSLDETYQRRLVRDASKLLRWRGTQRCLKGMLELITGGPVDVSDRGGVFREGEAGQRPPEVSIRVDSTGWLPEATFLEFIRDEVPANCYVGLVIGEREIWSLASREGG